MLSTYAGNSDKKTGLGQPLLGSGLGRLTLRMNFLWALSGNVLYAASQWGILVALAKLGTPQMVGEFALALAITAPVMIGTGLSLRGVQATDAAAEYLFGDYLLLRLLTTCMAGLLIAGIVWLSGYGWHTAAIILIVGMAKGFESISDVFFGLLQQHERMDRIALSMMIKGILSLAAITSAVYLSGDLLLGACGVAAAWALILVFYDISNGARVLQTLSKRKSSSVGLCSRLARLLELDWRPRSLAAVAFLALASSMITLCPPTAPSGISLAVWFEEW
jgi:O-antigen/teichoic acid export membrane protein